MLRKIESTIRTLTGLQYTQDDVRTSIVDRDFQRLTAIFEVAPEFATSAFLLEIIQFAVDRNSSGDMIWFLLETMGSCMGSFDGIPPGTLIDTCRVCHISNPYDRHTHSYCLALFVHGSQWVHDAYHIYHKYIEKKTRVPDEETPENLVLLLEVMLHETAVCAILWKLHGVRQSRYISAAMEITFSYSREVELAALWGTLPEYISYPTYSTTKGLYESSPNFAASMTTGPELVEMISCRGDKINLNRVFSSAISLADMTSLCVRKRYCRTIDDCLDDFLKKRLEGDGSMVHTFREHYLENICDILVSWKWRDYPAEYAYHVMTCPRIYRSLLNISHVLDNSRERLEWTRIVRLPSFNIADSRNLFHFTHRRGDFYQEIGERGDAHVRWFVVRALATRIIPCRSQEEREEFIRWRDDTLEHYSRVTPEKLHIMCKQKAHIDRVCLDVKTRINRSYHNLMTSLPEIDSSLLRCELLRLFLTLRTVGVRSLIMVPNEIMNLICSSAYPPKSQKSSRIPTSEMVLTPRR